MDSFPWAHVWQLNNVLLEGRWQVLWLMESNFHTMLHGHTAHSCFSMCLHNETLRNRTAGSERKMGSLENCLYTRQVAADDCPSVALSGGGRSRMKREAEPAGPARHHGFGLKSECLYFHFTYIITRVKSTLRIGQTSPKRSCLNGQGAHGTVLIQICHQETTP